MQQHHAIQRTHLTAAVPECLRVRVARIDSVTGWIDTAKFGNCISNELFPFDFNIAIHFVLWNCYHLPMFLCNKNNK